MARFIVIIALKNKGKRSTVKSVDIDNSFDNNFL